MFNPVGRILGLQIKRDKYGRNKDMPITEIEEEPQYDIFDPEHLTPQICTRCGERIRLKDIYHYKGSYKHKQCSDKDLTEKREQRRRK